MASAAALLFSGGCAPAGQSRQPAAVKAFPTASKRTLGRARQAGVWSGDTLQPAGLKALQVAGLDGLFVSAARETACSVPCSAKPPPGPPRGCWTKACNETQPCDLIFAQNLREPTS